MTNLRFRRLGRTGATVVSQPGAEVLISGSTPVAAVVGSTLYLTSEPTTPTQSHHALTWRPESAYTHIARRAPLFFANLLGGPAALPALIDRGEAC
jgi:hypothetical protein